MSADVVTKVVERAMDDAEFRRRLAEDPQAALAGYDLTDDERARFGSSGLRAERLEARMSKTDLSAMLGTRTSAPTIGPAKKRRR